MPVFDNNFILAVIAAVAAALPGIMAFVSQRRKDRADLAEKTRIAAAEVIETLTKRLNEFESDLTAARRARADSEAERWKLRSELERTRLELQEANAQREKCSLDIQRLEADIIRLNSRSADIESRDHTRVAASADRDARLAVLESNVKALSSELELWRTGKKTSRTGTTGPPRKISPVFCSSLPAVRT